MLKNPDIDIAPSLLEGLRLVSTPTATAYRMSQGCNHAYAIGIPAQVLDQGQTMVGRARTLRFLPKREDLLKDQYSTVGDRPHRDAIESIQPGEVLVIDACGSFEAGVVGDMYTRRVQELGGQGIVIDGCVRDMSTMATIGLPLFCKGMHGSGINRALMSADFQQPISIGNTAVLPGDVLLGDADGVVVVPPPGGAGVWSETSSVATQRGSADPAEREPPADCVARASAAMPLGPEPWALVAHAAREVSA